MDQRPIGVFDSGLGGLTAVAQLRRVLPFEDIVYLGDTGRVPYGGRSPETIARYAQEDFQFLREKDVKAVVVACGTVSSIALPLLQNRGIPVQGVVEAAARYAASVTENGRVGISGTEAAIRAGAYLRALRQLRPEVQAVSAACPRFVPLVENGQTDPADPELAAAVAEYLEPVRDFGADTVILGCTHYPLIEAAIRNYLGEGVHLVDVAARAVDALAETLQSSGALHERTRPGSFRCYVTGDAERFRQQAARFLCGGPVEAETVMIGEE